MVKERSVRWYGSMFPYLQNFSPDDQRFDDFFHSQMSNSYMISSIYDYDIGCEGDLFKAPEPIIEQPLITLCEEDDIIFQENKFTYFESLEENNFVSNLFDEYEDILAKETSSPSNFLDFKTDNTIAVKEILYPLGKFTKSISSDSFSISVEGAQMRPTSMNIAEIEMKNAHGIRRVCSEGYIKPQFMSDQIQETRIQKLSRYRDKKKRRNFGRKVKYACRKVLADGQPRIKGRFAKIEETIEK